MSPGSGLFLSAAEAIGDALCREALWWGRRCTWLGDEMLDDDAGTIVHRTADGSLYTGTAGIALFLARLGHATGDRVHTQTAIAATLQSLDQATSAGRLPLPGLFCGRVGAAYAAAAVGEMLAENELCDAGIALLGAVADEDASGWSDADVMHGRAGAVVAALRVSGLCGEPALGAWAERMGRALLDDAKRDALGWSWPGKPGELGLAGFSHGAAGVAWALGELAHSTGEDAFLRAMEEATHYEQHWFDAEQGNWRDVFPEVMCDPSRPPQYSMSWCHGAPGIALSRVRLWQLHGGEALLEQARAAVRSTAADLRARAADRRNFSLCHGLGGNAEALVLASVTLGADALLDVAREVGERGIERHRADESWPCGIDGSGAWGPGLMLGWAGIGYFYLRLEDPRSTPSLLILADCSCDAASTRTVPAGKAPGFTASDTANPSTVCSP